RDGRILFIYFHSLFSVISFGNRTGKLRISTRCISIKLQITIPVRNPHSKTRNEEKRRNNRNNNISWISHILGSANNKRNRSLVGTNRYQNRMGSSLFNRT